MELKSIDINFENCEYVTIPANMIGTFHIAGIQKEIHRRAVNSISDVNIANIVVMELFKSVDKVYFPFGIEEDQTTILERIKAYNDITSIEVLYEDGIKEHYVVDYDEGKFEDSLDAPNINQKVYTSKPGNVYIVIEKNKKIEDYFDLEKINDAETMKYLEDCYDIGIEKEYEQKFSADNLPDMYRYVYISEKGNGKFKQALAVRVFDENSGWKWVYEEKRHDIINMPTSFIYPTTKIVDFINKSKYGFSLKDIIEKYPILEKEPDKDLEIYPFFIEAKTAIKKLKDQSLI